MTRSPVQRADREYIAWLGGVESGAILPLKWVILVVCLLHWLWSRNWFPPDAQVFALFVFFAGSLAGEQYFFARDRITPRQVRPFVFASFVFDTLFVSALVLMDSFDPATASSSGRVSDYFILFVLLVLRGFALFRSRAENLAGFAIISAFFAGCAYIQLSGVVLLSFPGVLKTLVFVWAGMLLTQTFVGLVAGRRREELRTSEQLVRSASLASLGELSAGVAHEINNPIGIIKSYAEYLESTVSEDNPLHEDFETIRREAERCEELVKRMLTFSNPQIQGLDSVDVGELLGETVAFVFHEGEGRGAAITLEIAPNLPHVTGDPVQLRQAFLNILMNAKQILAEEEARRSGEGWNPEVEIVASRASGPRPPVRISVRDDGPGIAEGDAEKLFEPFYTRREKGTGLGLSITRRIIEAHDGSIRIAPSPKGGTIVTVELPMEGEEQS